MSPHIRRITRQFIPLVQREYFASCASCGEKLYASCYDSYNNVLYVPDVGDNQPRKYMGQWRCWDCYNELRNDTLPDISYHGIGGPSCPLETGIHRYNDASAFQENAIRDMENN